MRIHVCTALVAAALATAGCSSSTGPRAAPASPREEAGAAPVSRPSPADAAVPALDCGGAACAADQFCEERFKGHATDEQGRPLQHAQCMPVPDECRATPTCACITQRVSATHCDDSGGRVHLDDYPG